LFWFVFSQSANPKNIKETDKERAQKKTFYPPLTSFQSRGELLQ
jgi:hypothetical protein